MAEKVADKKEEIIRVIDSEGNWTGKYQTRGYVHSHGLNYNNVCTWIINSKNKTVLIEHRSPNKEHNHDKWCLPGGHVTGDETFVTAAKNEVREEVGIRINLNKFKFLCVTPPNGNSKSFKYHFYVIRNKSYKFFRIQKEEVAEIRYIKYNEWKKLVKSDSNKVAAKWGKWEKSFKIMDTILK
ncbi:MAG: NUDIX hydrolase [Mycoplasmataceae bacterium]|jgi:ADP-ribose pyrophosphatase YjhB (NUDIX family)|nr:NUDIX hydrolase [Mycoplasmataceae bacterium]